MGPGPNAVAGTGSSELWLKAGEHTGHRALHRVRHSGALAALAKASPEREKSYLSVKGCWQRPVSGCRLQSGKSSLGIRCQAIGEPNCWSSSLRGVWRVNYQHCFNKNHFKHD